MLLGRWRPGLLSVNCMWWKPQLIQDKLRHLEPTPQQQLSWRCARQCHVTYAPKGRGNGHRRVTGAAFSQRPESDSIQRRNQVLFRKTSGKHLDIPWHRRLCRHRGWENVWAVLHRRLPGRGCGNDRDGDAESQLPEDVHTGTPACAVWEQRCQELPPGS